MLTLMLGVSVVFFIMWVVLAEFVLEHRAHLKEHNLVIQGLIYLYGFCFIVVDILYNYTFGTIIFWQFTKSGDRTLSQRLRTILRTEVSDSWRWKLAYFVCRYLITPWDFNHCRIGLG